MSINIGVNIQRSPNRINQALRDAGVNGAYPKLLFDFNDEYYLTGGSSKTFANAMTFSRNGLATMVDSDGLIKWAPHNIFTYSEDFSAGIWSATEGGVKTSTTETDPAGGNTSVLFTSADSTSDLVYPVSVIGGVEYTLSFYAKLGTATEAKYRVYQGAEIIAPTSYFDQLSSEWALITVSFIPTSTAAASIFLFSNSAAGTIYFAFPHLYRSDLGGMVNNPDRSDSYVPTTSSAVYLPRRGHHVYNGDTWVNKGVLVESEARTNLLNYSNDFGGGDWSTVNAVAPAQTVTGIDGQTSATVFGDSNAGGTGLVNYRGTFNVSTSSYYTISVFAKADGLSWLGISLVNFTTPSNGTAFFDLANGDVGSAPSGFDAKISPCGNGFYRCSVSFLSDATDTNGSIYFQVCSADGVNTVDLDGTSSIILYGAQFESGSTPSSYIPTSGASVTRAAETITVPYANLPWPTPTYIGDELVTNGTFDTDTDWSKGGDWAIGGGVAYKSGGTGGSIIQSHAVEVGKIYEISFTVTSYTSGDILVYADGTYINISDSAGYKSVAYVATDTLLGYGVYGNSGSNFAIDNISVREINPLSVSIAMAGEVDYADSGVTYEANFYYWFEDSNNSIFTFLNTFGTRTGEIVSFQEQSGVSSQVSSDGALYSSGLNVPFNIASRHGSTFINGAVDGIALTANTTPVALPDLSTTDLNLAYDFNGTISSFRMWDKDIQDSGIATATEPSLEASLSLTFDGQPSSFTNTGVTV